MATKEEEVLPPVRMAEAMLQLGLHQKASVAFVSHYWASCCLGQWLDVVPIPQLLTIPALPPANPFQIGLPPTMHWTCRAVVPEVRRFQAEGERSLLPVKQTEALVQREATRSVLLQRVQDYALQGMRDQEYKALYPVWTTALERISLMRRWVARAPLGGKDHRPLTTLAIFDQQVRRFAYAFFGLRSSSFLFVCLSSCSVSLALTGQVHSRGASVPGLGPGSASTLVPDPCSHATGSDE